MEKTPSFVRSSHCAQCVLEAGAGADGGIGATGGGGGEGGGDAGALPKSTLGAVEIAASFSTVKLGFTA